MCSFALEEFLVVDGVLGNRSGDLRVAIPLHKPNNPRRRGEPVSPFPSSFCFGLESEGWRSEDLRYGVFNTSFSIST